MVNFNPNHKWYVLSLGGSLIVPNGGADVDFLKKFNRFIREKISAGMRFFIVCGGGATARYYRDAGKKIDPNITDFDLDWLGTHSTRLNAQLLRTLFRDICYQRVLKHYEVIEKEALNYKVVIAAGWKPGWSTDYDAVMLAIDYRVAHTVFNLSNIKGVYNKDPKLYPDAKMYKKLSWNQYIKIVGKRWKPGMNVPWDPIASQLAREHGVQVIVCDGRNLQNFQKILKGKKDFEGTIIG
jgi:uridylate kinase